MMAGGFMMIAFWDKLIVLVIVLIRWIANEGTGPLGGERPRGDAIDILKEHFARGKVDKEVYHARRKTLESGDR